jgi:hypothetical protein
LNQSRSQFIFSGNSGVPPLLLKCARETPTKSTASGPSGRQEFSPRRHGGHGGKFPRALARKPAFSVTSVFSVVQTSFLARDRANAAMHTVGGVKIDSQCQRAVRGRTIIAEARSANLTPAQERSEIQALQRTATALSGTGKIFPAATIRPSPVCISGKRILRTAKRCVEVFDLCGQRFAIYTVSWDNEFRSPPSSSGPLKHKRIVSH